MVTPKVDSFFHETSNNVTYVVADPATGRCAVIDTVLDYDARSGRTATVFADEIIAFVRAEGLGVDWILETHIHADHLTAAPYFKDKLGGCMGIGSGVTEVQKTFGALFNAGPDFATDGSQFDHLFADGERFAVGGIEAEVLHTPGHTPACVCYRIGDTVFVGDTIFMPDAGTARCDFPGGCAKTLYRSLNRILALPDDTRLYINHDYGAGGQRAIAWQTTVAEERAANIHCKEGTSEDEYVRMREARDATLAMPNLLLPAVQINMRGGHFPPPEDNGTAYLKLPLNAV